MDIFDQILENLELERELGARTVEVDRTILAPLAAEAPVVPPPQGSEARSPDAEIADARRVEPVGVASGDWCDILFLTGRDPSSEAMDALDKTFVAMKRIKTDLRICLNEERKAKILVLLGSDALKKHHPTARPVRGAWIALAGTPAVMTFSPDYIFSHFQKGSARMNEAKKMMWNDIKSAVARLLSVP